MPDWNKGDQENVSKSSTSLKHEHAVSWDEVIIEFCDTTSSHDTCAFG